MKFSELFENCTVLRCKGLLDKVTIPTLYTPKYIDVSSGILS